MRFWSTNVLVEFLGAACTARTAREVSLGATRSAHVGQLAISACGSILRYRGENLERILRHMPRTLGPWSFTHGRAVSVSVRPGHLAYVHTGVGDAVTLHMMDVNGAAWQRPNHTPLQRVRLTNFPKSCFSRVQIQCTYFLFLLFSDFIFYALGILFSSKRSLPPSSSGAWPCLDSRDKTKESAKFYEPLTP